MKLARLASLVVGLAALLGCSNPVPDAYIAELGAEDPGVPPSDIHRPGQPCLLCHGPYVGAEPEMSVAGTIYGYAFDGNPDAAPVPVEGVTLELIDTGSTSPMVLPKTNCAGNFYVKKSDWNPSFPIRAAIRYPTADKPEGQRVAMSTRISRDGSCSGCHSGDPNQGSPGWVFCAQRTPDGPKFTAATTCVPNPGN
jgi:hypothetical protein